MFFHETCYGYQLIKDFIVKAYYRTVLLSMGIHGSQAYIKAFWNFSGTNTYKSALLISFPQHTFVLYSTFGHLKVTAALLYPATVD